MNCEKSKVALPSFRPASVEQFVLEGFALMLIQHQADSAEGFIQ